MALTLGQAAKQAGLSKPTLSKHIRNGRLTAKKGEDGVYQIEEAELGRFMSSYRRAEPVEAATGLPPGQGADRTASGVEVDLAVVQERARQLEERLAEAKAALEKAEETAETARAEAAEARAAERAAWQRVAGLLEGPRAEPQGWWAKLTRR